MNAKEIRELFQRHGLEVSRSDIWEVQGNPVIHHKAVERLGVMIGIEWHQPQILRAEKDEAVMIVTGKVGERLEWSVGEAAIGQNYRVSGKQAAYVFCMAEKRGRDRVILKLAGLHGAYSEEEADDFRQGERPNPNPREVPGVVCMTEDGPRPATIDDLKREFQPNQPPTQSSSKDIYISQAIGRMGEMESAPQLLEWAKTERKMVWPQYGIEPHDEDGQRFVTAYKERMAVLERASKTEAA
jgi:hypothetical protein